jgi:hypothetical protein
VVGTPCTHSYRRRKTPKPQAIFEAIQLRYQVDISYQAARRVKHLLLRRTVADRAKQYQQLPAYVERLCQSNPGTTYTLVTDPVTHRFQRIFICPITSHLAFRHIRGLVAVDGTFMKGSFVQTLLAVALDAENQILVLAWALVEGENESSWRWFLRQLKEGIVDFDDDETTLISDRDKGLQSAEDELEFAKRAYCTQHMAANVQSRYGIEVRRLFVAATYARTVAQFDEAMEKLRDANGQAYLYVNAIDVSLWAAPYMVAKRWGQMTSNIVESINAAHKEDRCLSCVDLLNAIWNRTMDVSFNLHQDALKSLAQPGARFTNFALRLLENSLDHAQQRQVEVTSTTERVITTLQDKRYVVDLALQTCECGRYQVNCIPCGHAVALIVKLRKPPRDYIPDFFKLDTYRKTYARNIRPVSTCNLAVSAECYPPQLKRARGRPRERRIRTGERVKRRVGQQAAGMLPDVPERAPQRCGQCNQVGHNRAMCGEVAQFPFL